MTQPRLGPARVLGVLLGLLFASACPDGAPPDDKKPNPPAPQASTAPVRRLTQAELARTLRDLFPGQTLPTVALSDGQPPPGAGAKFEGDVTRQTPSDLVVEQLRAAAIAVSAQVAQRPDLLLPRIPSADVEDQRAVGHELIASFGPQALRRPFDDGEEARYAAFFDGILDTEGFETAVRALVQAFLQSPSFIYRLELAATGADGELVPVTGYDMANRLSYFLWGTMPDPVLFERAADGSLDDVDGVVAEAERMLTDDKARDGVLSHFRQWLDFDRILGINKDPASFPFYNDDLRRAMRTEADLFVASVIFDGDARFETLMTSNLAPINAALASVYGVAAPAQDWDIVELPAEERAGLLTQAQFLAARAHAIEPSPVQRGVFVFERMLCEPPPAPEGNIDTTPPPADPNVQTTNRERFAQHTFDPVCQSCHISIDGIGFGLESYDAVGRFRTMDNGLPVDASGTLEGTSLGGTFHGGVELAGLLAESERVKRCVARHWLRNSLGRVETRADASALDEVAGAFIDSDGDIPALLLAIVRSDSFRVRPAVGGAE